MYIIVDRRYWHGVFISSIRNKKSDKTEPVQSIQSGKFVSHSYLEGIMHARWLENARHSKNAISHTEKPLAQKKNSLRKRMDLRFWSFVFQYPKHYVLAFMRTSAMRYKNVQDGVFDVSNESYGEKKSRLQWNSRPVGCRDGSSQGGDHCS